MTEQPTACPYCEQQHAADLLCPPAAALLAAVKAKSDSMNLPTIEFDDAITVGDEQMTLVSGLITKAVVVDVAGVPRAGIVFHPQLPSGTTHPGLLYVGTDDEIRRLGNLVNDCAAIALRHAERQRRPTNGGPR